MEEGTGERAAKGATTPRGRRCLRSARRRRSPVSEVRPRRVQSRPCYSPCAVHSDWSLDWHVTRSGGHLPFVHPSP